MFLTNNFALPALTIAELYRCRWQVELFFKWIKQHLRIKRLLRHLRERRQNPNLDRGLGLRARGHRQKGTASRTSRCIRLLQILSVTLFEKVSLQQALADAPLGRHDPQARNQLTLFEC